MSTSWVRVGMIHHGGDPLPTAQLTCGTVGLLSVDPSMPSAARRWILRRFAADSFPTMTHGWRRGLESSPHCGYFTPQ